MWLYEGKEFTSDQIKDYYGFVYCITGPNGRKYIGRKYFSSKFGKKRKESDWKKYKSSCKELIDDIKSLGENNFIFEILSLHKKRGEVNYEETRQQFLRNVLFCKLEDGSREYYNANIMLRFYAPRESKK
jgi:hypothetical protein